MQLKIREIRRIRIESGKDSTATARKIRQLVGGKCLSLSIRTIQRYLMRVGRLLYRPSKSPQLTARQRATRYKRAKAHKNFDFSNVVFSDETYIELASNSNLSFFRESKGEKMRLIHSKPHKSFNRKLLI